MKRENIIGFRVSEDLRRILDKISQEMGLTVSEYMRKLVLDDLERRSIITTKIDLIKEEIRNGTKKMPL